MNLMSRGSAAPTWPDLYSGSHPPVGLFRESVSCICTFGEVYKSYNASGAIQHLPVNYLNLHDSTLDPSDWSPSHMAY